MLKYAALSAALCVAVTMLHASEQTMPSEVAELYNRNCELAQQRTHLERLLKQKDAQIMRLRKKLAEIQQLTTQSTETHQLIIPGQSWDVVHGIQPAKVAAADKKEPNIPRHTTTH